MMDSSSNGRATRADEPQDAVCGLLTCEKARELRKSKRRGELGDELHAILGVGGAVARAIQNGEPRVSSDHLDRMSDASIERLADAIASRGFVVKCYTIGACDDDIKETGRSEHVFLEISGWNACARRGRRER
jgi:hypothetical protein